MQASVDLTARTGGLLPYWLFLLIATLWLAAMVVVWRKWDAGGERTPSLAAAGTLILANVLFFWRPLFTGAHLPQGGGDLNSFFFTLHAYSAERVSSGEIPLWNPYLHGGMPHLGNFQAGFLYPPNLIAYLVAQPFSYGTLEWLAILHYLTASIGGYLLLRALGAGRIGAVAGGLLFAYGGFFAAHLGHYSMISAAAWLPWLFWAVYRLVDSRSWWWGAGLGSLVFLTASGGHQQTLLFALLGIGIWWIFLMLARSEIRVPGVGAISVARDDQFAWRRLWNRDSASALVQFGGGVSAGLLLAAPMIIPSLQLAQRSVRSTLTIDQASEFSVQPVALLQLILPTVFGSNPTDYWGPFSSGEIWGYIGVTTLVIAAVGIVLRPSVHRLFFLGLALIALLYAVGPAAPIHGWFYQFVPGFDLVRAPARAYVYFNLSVAILAGLAISDLSRRVPKPGVALHNALDRVNRSLLIIIGVTGLLVIPFFYTRILGVADPPNRPVITVDNLWMMLLFLSLLLGVLWLARLGALRQAALGLAITAVLLLDLFSATMPFNPTEEDLVASYREPEVTSYLLDRWEADGPFRIEVQHPGLLPNFGMIEGFHVGSGVFDPMQPAAWTTAYTVAAEEPARPAWDMFNVRFLILDAGSEPPSGFELAFESGAGTRVWERDDAMPRAWFVTDVIEVPLEHQADLLREPEFDPAEQVLIQDAPFTKDGDADGSVEIVHYEPERITIDVEVDGPGYIVLSEGDYPGWSAEVDGSAVDVLTSNFGLRAVGVDADTDVVELRYEPSLVTLGVVLSGFGGLLLVGLIAWPLIVLQRVVRAKD